MGLPALKLPEDLDAGTRQLVERALDLDIADDVAAKVAREMRDDLYRLRNARDEQRKEETALLREALGEMEAPHKLYISSMDGIIDLLTEKLRDFLKWSKQQREERQRKHLEDHNRKKAEEEARAAKARAEREEAERKAEEARRKAAEAKDAQEQTRLLNEAAKSDRMAVKADAALTESMTKAATMAPEVVQDTSKQALGQWRDNWTWDFYAHGKRKGTDVFGDDEDHDFFKPEYARYWMLDERRLNTDVKNGIKVPLVNRTNKPTPVTSKKAK